MENERNSKVSLKRSRERQRWKISGIAGQIKEIKEPFLRTEGKKAIMLSKNTMDKE